MVQVAYVASPTIAAPSFVIHELFFSRKSRAMNKRAEAILV